MALFLFPGGLVLDSLENNYRLNVLSLISEQKKTVLSAVSQKSWITPILNAALISRSHIWLLGVNIVENRYEYLQWKSGLVRGHLIHYCN